MMKHEDRNYELYSRICNNDPFNSVAFGDQVGEFGRNAQAWAFQAARAAISPLNPTIFRTRLRL
jgi:hypothetical protein